VSGDPGVKIVFIKKKNKGHGHHGGAWKVAYADFVTAMMALFIVLWLLTQSDQASKEQIAEYFRTGTMPGGSLMVGKPGGSTPPRAINIFPDGQGEAAAVAETKGLRILAKDVGSMLAKAKKNPEFAALAKHVKVRVVNEGALIELVEGGDNFLFNVASSELKPGAITILEQLAPMLKSLTNKIEIHGHTDARPFGVGSKKTNWELSFERGDQARRVLEGQGIEKGKIQSVLAHADTALYLPDQPLAPENRRLSILVVRASAQRSRAGLNTQGDLDKDDAESSKAKPRPTDDEDAPKVKSRLDDDDDAANAKSKLSEDDDDAPKGKSKLDDGDSAAPRSKAAGDDDEAPKGKKPAGKAAEPAAPEAPAQPASKRARTGKR
jgi:chemotaxis protein MotB